MQININILVTEYLTSLQYGKMFYEIYIKTIPLLEDLV